MSVTDRQRQILRHIYEHMVKRGYPPSVRDLCAVTGISSPNGVADHIKALAKKGMVERNNHARSLLLTAEGERALGLGDEPDELERAAKLALVAPEGVLEGRGQFRFIEARTAVQTLRLAGVK